MSMRSWLCLLSIALLLVCSEATTTNQISYQFTFNSQQIGTVQATTAPGKLVSMKVALTVVDGDSDSTDDPGYLSSSQLTFGLVSGSCGVSLGTSGSSTDFPNFAAASFPGLAGTLVLYTSYLTNAWTPPQAFAVGASTTFKLGYFSTWVYKLSGTVTLTIDTTDTSGLCQYATSGAATPAPVASPSLSRSPSPPALPSLSRSPSLSPSPVNGPSQSSSASPSASLSPSPRPSASPSASLSPSASASGTPGPSASPVPSNSASVSPSPSPSPQPSPSPAGSPSVSDSPRPSASPAPSDSVSASPLPSPSPEPSPSPAASLSPSPAASDTPAPTASPAPSDSISASAVPTPSPEPSPSPTGSPSPSAAASDSAAPSVSPALSDSASASPSASPSPPPSPSPDRSPSPSPAASDSPAPSASPVPSGSTSASPLASLSPQPSPSPSSSPPPPSSPAPSPSARASPAPSPSPSPSHSPAPSPASPSPSPSPSHSPNDQFVPVADATVLDQVLTSAGVAIGSDPATATPAFNLTRIYTEGEDAYGLYYAADTNFARAIPTPYGSMTVRDYGTGTERMVVVASQLTRSPILLGSVLEVPAGISPTAEVQFTSITRYGVNNEVISDIPMTFELETRFPNAVFYRYASGSTAGALVTAAGGSVGPCAVPSATCYRITSRTSSFVGFSSPDQSPTTATPTAADGGSNSALYALLALVALPALGLVLLAVVLLRRWGARREPPPLYAAYAPHRPRTPAAAPWAHPPNTPVGYAYAATPWGHTFAAPTPAGKYAPGPYFP